MKYYFIVILSLYCFAGWSQSANRNYVLTRDYKQVGAGSSEINKVKTSVQYFDGIGRPIQNISVAVSPVATDLVEVQEYDPYGRIVKEYLPYTVGSSLNYGAFQANAINDAISFYTNAVGNLNMQGPDFARPTVQTVYESSPLNRVLNVRQAGNRSVASVITYGANVANEVKRYDYSANSNILLTVTQNSYYLAGTLYKTQVTDENSKVSVEYKDISGQLVCKRAYAASGAPLDTYYIYDDLEQLRAVLQPKYQDDPSTAEYAFLYEYDTKGRAIRKKLPGVTEVELVYDNFDRLAASRDANQKARNVWGFIKYDALNRVVMKGEVVSYTDRTQWQGYFDASQAHHEDKTTSGIGYTLGNVQPNLITESNVHVVNYYDDYSFPKPAGYDFTYSNPYNVTSLTAPKNLMTGTRVRMFPGNNSVGDWLVSVTYYDSEYRPLQTVRQLYDLGAGVVEKKSIQYKFNVAPVIAEEKTEHFSTGTLTAGLTKTYTLDQADRLLSVKEKVVSGSLSKELFTSARRYNRIGQLQSKWFQSPGTDGTTFLRRTTYRYNIRGRLGDAHTEHKNAAGADQSYTYMGLTYYSSPTTYSNGNIDSLKLGPNPTTIQGYAYTYDGTNRLKTTVGINNPSADGIETNINYDKNGNILNLTRTGTYVDNLTYTYTGNRMTSLNDGSGNNTGVKSGVSSYGYDSNGNLTSDGNRSATLTYHHFDRPKTVAVGGKTFLYDYDAQGVKRKYNADTLILKYEGPFEYRQVGSANQLYRIALTEGQAIIRNGTLQFHYYYKDHLENVRLVYDESGKDIHRTNYYPFGLAVDRNNPVTTQAARNSVNRYLFIEREIQIGTGYMDLIRRFYDPATGRFMQVDPVVETQEHLSVYQYGWNNPTTQSDPNGDCPNCIAAAIGAGVGALIGGGIEAGTQIYRNGGVSNWKAVGGAALQGFITGGVTGLTGGANLLATAAVSAGANVVGGAANNLVQGKQITASSVATDAVTGAAAGAAGKVVGNIVKGATDNLSNASKGKLGEAITEIKYGMQGYKSTGKAIVETGKKTPGKNLEEVAKYDHAMVNVFTGKKLTVESKFNSAGLTRNQRAAKPNVTTAGGLILDKTTSQQLGNWTGAGVTGAGSGATAQRER